MVADWVVHVIDDDEAIRDSLRFMLESSDHEVVLYESAEDFLDGVSDLAPGWIVTDVRMPGLSGLELLAELKARGLGALPVIVITGHGDVPMAVEAMRAGAVDFIEKPFEEERLLAALDTARAAMAGNDAAHAERLEIARRLQTLSGRERDVLEGLIAGRANKVIAHDLGISARTVEIYRANLMTKMKASSLSELVRMALAVRS